jgi:hypothetical protein
VNVPWKIARGEMFEMAWLSWDLSCFQLDGVVADVVAVVIPAAAVGHTVVEVVAVLTFVFAVDLGVMRFFVAAFAVDVVDAEAAAGLDVARAVHDAAVVAADAEDAAVENASPRL